MLTIVAFGDSLTAGSALQPEQENWTDLLAQRLSARVINSGVGGNTILQGLARLESDVLAHAPHLVLICFGMNDHVICDAMGNTNTPEDTFAEILFQIVEQVRNIGAIPVLITPNAVLEEYYYTRHPAAWYDKAGGANAQLNRFCEHIRTVAEKKAVLLIDLFTESQRRNLSTLLRTPLHGNFPDGVHPYGDGISFYAEQIFQHLQTIPLEI